MVRAVQNTIRPHRHGLPWVSSNRLRRAGSCPHTLTWRCEGLYMLLRTSLLFQANLLKPLLCRNPEARKYVKKDLFFGTKFASYLINKGRPFVKQMRECRQSAVKI